MTQARRLLIMAGGTGGHVIPALDVAKAFVEKGYDVHWLGTRKGIEARLVPAAGIPIHYVTVSGIRRTGWLRKVMLPFVLLRAILQASRHIARLQPAVVLGFGGYVSAPGGFSAWLLRKPLVIHEQNAIAGKTNGILSRLACKTLAAFPETKGLCKPQVVGNPVRASIASGAMSDEAYPLEHSYREIYGDSPAVNVLVLGGSGGAKQLNESVPVALSALTDVRVKVWHQAGQRSLKLTQAAYEATELMVYITPYIEEMATAYGWADLIICRAGAMTVFEVMAAGKAALFIPYPYAVDDHQRVNAEYLVNQQAAQLICPQKFSVEILSDVLDSMLLQKQALFQMGLKARSLYLNNSLSLIVEVVEEVVSSATTNVSR